MKLRLGLKCGYSWRCFVATRSLFLAAHQAKSKARRRRSSHAISFSFSPPFFLLTSHCPPNTQKRSSHAISFCFKPFSSPFSVSPPIVTNPIRLGKGEAGRWKMKYFGPISPKHSFRAQEGPKVC